MKPPFIRVNSGVGRLPALIREGNAACAEGHRLSPAILIGDRCVF